MGFPFAFNGGGYAPMGPSRACSCGHFRCCNCDGGILFQGFTRALLKALGVCLDIDDFGTGYSSLSRLQAFPVDALKIDRAFISRIDTDTETHEIVRIIVMLAHGLRLKVVAEGVETPRQAEMLKEIGCEMAQGYLYSKPVPAGAIEQLLTSNRAANVLATRATSATSTLA